MSKPDCSKVKPCDQCVHFSFESTGMFEYTYNCRRLQERKCSLLCKDDIVYRGSLLSCSSERGIGRTPREWIFGENKNKCGEEGRFWEKNE